MFFFFLLSFVYHRAIYFGPQHKRSLENAIPHFNYLS